MHPDPKHREMVVGHLKKVIAAAEMLDVPIVGTFIGRDKDKTLEDNWAMINAIKKLGAVPLRRYRIYEMGIA